MKRFFAFLCIAVMLLSCSVALAWDCESCGATGNNGNFCPGCGKGRPVVLVQETDWHCSHCGAQGNTGAFCVSCGNAKSSPYTVPNNNVEVGEYVFFGRYEQDNNGVNGQEKLEWLVLDVQGDKALLITRYGLSRTKMNGTSNRVAWDETDLRRWCNKTFLNGAFTSSERDAILTTYVEEGIGQCHPEAAPKRLGKDTEDKVFLLSYAEMVKYLPDPDDRMCAPTDKAKAEGCNVSDRRYLDGEYKTCWYWLRSPAYNNNFVVVDWNGALETCYMSHNYGVVRPALWVNVSALN